MAQKVIFVSNIVGNGGAGRVMSLVANYFVDSGIDVTICSFLDCFDTYEMNKKVRNILIKPQSKKAPICKLKRILMLRKVFRDNPNATIIAFEYFVNLQILLAALFLRNKVIISERNDPKQLDNRYVMKIARDIIYKITNVLVCQTPQAKNYFSNSVKKKTVVIPNPIIPNLPERYMGERKKEIVSFCRLEPQKNLKMTIDAFYAIQQEYPDYILSIYGEGSEKEKLLRHIKRLGLSQNVNINDFSMEIHNIINQSAMFVSSSNYEGISNSMLEAMGMGLPSVVTDCPCGGARMFIKSYINGILVPVGDTRALYTGMKYIIENKVEAEKISENAVKIKEELAADKISLEWLRIL